MLDKAYGIKPEYRKLAQIAYDTVLRVMTEGAKTHPGDGWKDIRKQVHIQRALRHMDNAYCGLDTGEDDIAHCLTRCAMVLYLKGMEAKSNEQTKLPKTPRK